MSQEIIKLFLPQKLNTSGIRFFSNDYYLVKEIWDKDSKFDFLAAFKRKYLT